VLQVVEHFLKFTLTTRQSSQKSKFRRDIMKPKQSRDVALISLAQLITCPRTLESAEPFATDHWWFELEKHAKHVKEEVPRAIAFRTTPQKFKVSLLVN
jgi:hypothetical protein